MASFFAPEREDNVLGLSLCGTFSSGHHHWSVKDPKTFSPSEVASAT